MSFMPIGRESTSYVGGRSVSHWSLDLYLEYLSRLSPPEGPFEGEGPWEHVYDVFPIYADLHGLPPLLIHVGTAELLLDDAVRLADRARAAGVEVVLEPWEDMIHVWHCFAHVLPEGQQAIDRVGEFISEHTGS